MAEQVLFWVFAIGTIAGAGGVIAVRNPVASAISLVATFFFLAGTYVLLWAHTIAVIQVLVYAGAIMVLFLFVIMLLGAERSGGGIQGLRDWEWVLAGFLGAALVVLFVTNLVLRPTAGGDTAPFIDTSPAALGLRLFEAYVFPFELTGVLLLTAMIGVVVLGRRKKMAQLAQGGDDA